MQALSPDIRTLVPVAGHLVAPDHAHDYSLNPMLVYWEMTRACSLACRHCRAEAAANPQEWELTFAESKSLLSQIAGFNKPLPHLILTGGDPLERTDLYELIDEARRFQIPVSITPSATANLTPDTLAKLRDHGIESIGLSLDGSSAERHDAARGVAGCFDKTIRAIRDASRLGLQIQINTLVSQETMVDLPETYELLEHLPVTQWCLFFLISTGRGTMLRSLTADQAEKCLQWIYELAKTSPFTIRTTEAPFYRRVALERMKQEGRSSEEIKQSSVYRGFEIRDGHGVVFISNQGHIYPAGFLPLQAGNIRHDHLVDIYRHSPLFRALRVPSAFRGKCGECEYAQICGGSRSRAFAFSGDPLSSDPLCSYESCKIGNPTGAG